MNAVVLQKPVSMLAHTLQRDTVLQSDITVGNVLNCFAHEKRPKTTKKQSGGDLTADRPAVQIVDAVPPPVTLQATKTPPLLIPIQLTPAIRCLLLKTQSPDAVAAQQLFFHSARIVHLWTYGRGTQP